MLSLEDYRILNCCADDYELFYVPFAELNFDGQVFRRSSGPHCLQYEDEQDWKVEVTGATIIAWLRSLVGQGFLGCWLLPEDSNGRPVSVEDVANDELDQYLLYSCVTFDDHIERSGYGPHEFKTTELGLREIDKDEYRMYDESLGWT